MSRYSFDRKYERKGTNSTKWDYCPNDNVAGEYNPMWIADMEFATPDCIVEALKKRLEHPIFGYVRGGERFSLAIMEWQKKRFGVENIAEEQISYQNTVVGAVTSALYALTKEGDPVLLHSPCYTGFTACLQLAKRTIISSPLVQDEAGVFHMDFADMEKKIVEHNIKCTIFCSPHNPTGRVWTKEEQQQLAALCEKHDVKIISDEIWADIVMKGYQHIPFQSVCSYAKQNTIACYAPTKTFNLAGFQVAYSIVYNPELQQQYKAIGDKTKYNALNVMSLEAITAGYTHGEAWVEDLCTYLEGNIDYACDYIHTHFPKIKVIKPQATYLLWLDMGAYETPVDEIVDAMARQGLVPGNGKAFGGTHHIRVNLATQRDRVELGMKQLEAALQNIQ